MTNKHVLVIDGAGLTGSNLVKRLVENWSKLMGEYEALMIYLA